MDYKYIFESLTSLQEKKEQRSTTLNEISAQTKSLIAGSALIPAAGLLAWYRYRQRTLLLDIQQLQSKLQVCYTKYRDNPEKCESLEKQMELNEKKLKRFKLATAAAALASAGGGLALGTGLAMKLSKDPSKAATKVATGAGTVAASAYKQYKQQK